MKCPKCGTVCKSTQQLWQERMRALGRCLSCGVDKSEKDLPFSRCFQCRRKAADRGMRYHARRRARGIAI